MKKYVIKNKSGSISSSTEGVQYTLSETESGFELLKDNESIGNRITWPSSFSNSKEVISILYRIFNSNVIVPDDPDVNYRNWKSSLSEVTPTDENPYVWMAIRHNDEEWNLVCLTGAKGKDGKDGTDGINGSNTAIDYDGVDFIFCNTTKQITDDMTSLKDQINNDESHQTTNFSTSKVFTVGDNVYTITGDAIGITQEKPYEYMGIRIKQNGKFVIKSFTLWSKWGEKGSDGARVEYIFATSSSDPATWDDNASYNPQSWSAQEYFDEPDYMGLTDLDTTVIKNGRWYDNPGQCNYDSDYPYIICSIRKYVNAENSGEFSKPAIWSRWINVERFNTNIQVVCDKPVIAYNQGTNPDPSVTIRAYYGSQLIKVLKVKEVGEITSDINNATSNNELVFNFVKTDSTKIHNYQVTIDTSSVLDSDTVVKNFTINEIVIPTASGGSDGVSYKLIINPSIIQFDDHGELLTTQLNYSILRNGAPINYNTVNWEIKFTTIINGDSHDIETRNNSNYSTYSTKIFDVEDTDYTNGDYIEAVLKIDSNIWDQINIPVIKNSQNIESQYLIRERGEWDSETQYYGLDDPESVDNIKYVDVVYVIDGGEVYHYYLCKQSNTGQTPTASESEYWESAYSMNFAYINTLIADAIRSKSVQSEEVLITQHFTEEGVNVEKIVAGMTSGNAINGGSNVRIWAGSKVNTQRDAETGAITNTSIDLTNAPFRVYDDGYVVANNVSIALHNLKSNDDITLPDFTPGTILYFAVTTNNSYTIQCNGTDNSYLCLYHGGGTFSSNTRQVEVNEPGVYFVCATEIDGKRVWLLTHTVYKIITGGGLEAKKVYHNGSGWYQITEEANTVGEYLSFTISLNNPPITFVPQTAYPSDAELSGFEIETDAVKFYARIGTSEDIHLFEIDEKVWNFHDITATGETIDEFTGIIATFNNKSDDWLTGKDLSNLYFNCMITEPIGDGDPVIDPDGWYLIGTTSHIEGVATIAEQLNPKLSRIYYVPSEPEIMNCEVSPSGMMFNESGAVTGYVDGDNIKNTSNNDVITTFQNRPMRITKKTQMTLAQAEATYRASQEDIEQGQMDH